MIALLSTWVFLNLFSSVNVQAETIDFCPGILKVSLETNETVYYCRVENWMVSKNCYLHQSSCGLLDSLHKKLPKILAADQPLLSTRTHNPASPVCNRLGLKVLMGKVGNDNAICTCENPTHESIICTSLLD